MAMSLTAAVLILTSWQCFLATGIDIVTTKFDGLKPIAFDIVCTPNYPDIYVQEIISIQIMKGLHRLVSLQPNSNITYATELPINVEAKGLIDPVEAGKSYLGISISYTMPIDSAEYTCLIYSKDKNGIVNHEKTTGALDISGDEFLQPHMRYVFKKLSMQENTMKILTNQQKEQDLLLKHLGFQQKNTDMRIAELEEITKNLSSYNQRLMNTRFEPIAFRASITPDYTVLKGKTIVFGTVLTKQGRGYDENTGLFIAPVKGLYAFHLTMIPTGAKTCPSEWSLYAEGMACIKVFSTKKRNWNDARNDCISKGADLIRIENEKKQQFLKGLCSVWAWIGLKRKGSGKQFSWLDDSSLATYTNWNTDEPNNSGGDEYCTHIIDGAVWNDKKCSLLENYVCEKRALFGSRVVIKVGDEEKGVMDMARNNNSPNQGSISSVVELEAGQVVSVVATWPSYVSISPWYNMKLNSVFSGYLLNEK